MPNVSPSARSNETKAFPYRVPAAPRLVVGFNLVSQKPDCDASPRSVKEVNAFAGIAKVASHERNPRSPKSGLESLLSSSRPGNTKGSEDVGTRAFIHGKEGGGAKVGCVEIAEESAVIVPEVKLVKCCAARPHAPTQPIPITPTPLRSSSLGKAQVGKAFREDVHDAGARSRGGVRKQARGFCVVWDDDDAGKPESILSTSSPASSCNEIVGGCASMDFLSACYLCKRALSPGKDIFMYRGDRAFCTAECRYQQIVVDERRERVASANRKPGTAGTSESSNFRSKIVAATVTAAA